MAKGDKVEIMLQVGDTIEKREVTAWKAGQRIVVDRPRGSATMDVIVEDRHGNSQQHLTLKVDAVLAVIEKPKT